MFTQKVSMDCTQEQYEKFLKDELLKMGYKESSICYWKNFKENVLVNYYLDTENSLANTNITDRNNYNRSYLGSFNAPLFLALAAMTDKPKGGYREYFTDGVNWIASEGKWISEINPFRKATVSEIMEKFGEKPKELTDLDKLAARVEKLEQHMVSYFEREIKAMPTTASFFDCNNKPKSWSINPQSEIEIDSISVIEIPQAVPYQLCPKCGESGIILESLTNLDGQTRQFRQTCDLCKGKMMIPMHVINN